MSGHKPFDELTKDWPEERRKRVEDQSAGLVAKIGEQPQPKNNG